MLSSKIGGSDYWITLEHFEHCGGRTYGDSVLSSFISKQEQKCSQEESKLEVSG